MLGEAVGLVADVLQQPQGIAVAAQPQRLVAAGHVNLFLALGQRKDRRRPHAQRVQGAEGRVKLPLAAVDQEDVGQGVALGRSFGQPLESPRNGLVDAGKIVDALRPCGSAAADSPA